MTHPTHPDGARLDFAGAMSYGDYLQLDRLLGAQRLLSTDPNELLFIVQHQASELWLKLVVHELTLARDHVASSDLQPAFKMLARVARIMAQLNQSWTCSPRSRPEYSAFRGSLGNSSGFQSYQYRMVEFLWQQQSANGAASPSTRRLRGADGSIARRRSTTRPCRSWRGFEAS